jgi:hypothetical protein
MLVDRTGSAIQIEQGVVGRDEVADLWDEFDDPFARSASAFSSLKIDRYRNGRRSPGAGSLGPGDRD